MNLLSVHVVIWITDASQLLDVIPSMDGPRWYTCCDPISWPCPTWLMLVASSWVQLQGALWAMKDVAHFQAKFEFPALSSQKVLLYLNHPKFSISQSTSIWLAIIICKFSDMPSSWTTKCGFSLGRLLSLTCIWHLQRPLPWSIRHSNQRVKRFRRYFAERKGGLMVPW